jgi:UDP-N-acetylmuramoyl-tripeptide--D-alanyl-D-alanine ligase
LQNQRYKFSLNSALADFYLEYSAELKTHTFYHKNQKIISFSTPYKANHHLSALAIAISIATLLELNKNEILSGIKNCENISFRQKLLNFKNFSVFDDTYSSSIEAIKSDIEYLKLEYPKRSLSFALGDILELGTETFNIHKSVGNLAYYAGAKKLYAFGSYAYLIREGAEEAGMNPQDIYTFTEPDYHKKAAEEILKNTLNNEIVLVKASHALHSEKIIEEIERLAKEC